jgi:hypothetical protein
MTAACTDRAIATMTTATAETATVKARRDSREREGRRSRGTEETGRRVVGYRGRAYNRTGRQDMACTVIRWKSTGIRCDWLDENGDVLLLVGRARGCAVIGWTENFI